MRQAYRASVYHCLSDPSDSNSVDAVEFIEDALLIVENGRIAGLGEWAVLAETFNDVPVVDLSGKLILPGLIDCHVHFPQVDIIASYGDQLLDWLNHYAYPGERAYADKAYARKSASFFLDELLKNGTTTAAVFATVHPQSATALFAAAEDRNMRLIAGKVLMDHNCPDDLRDDPESAYVDSKALIERWHGKGRLGYAITPRFALTSSEEQLDAAGRLAKEHPDTWVHTHLAENHEEIRQVASQFPWAGSYLDVYDRFGLLRERSVFAHCLHLEDKSVAALATSGAAAAFCPTSNLFLGSGLFDLERMVEAGVRVGLATDVGGGTSLSMFQTMNEAYKVLAMQGQKLPASRAVYLATLGAARSLHLDDTIGNFETGKEADFVVIDINATDIASRRAHSSRDIDETLFAIMILADDRHVLATAICGELSLKTEPVRSD